MSCLSQHFFSDKKSRVLEVGVGLRQNLLPLEHYDLIIAHNIIEHFTKQEIKEIIDLVYKALRKSGVFVASTPNAESLFSSRIRCSDFTHEIAFTPTSLSMVLRLSGFNDIKIFPKEPYIHGIKSLFRWILWKTIKQLIKFYLLVETGEIGYGVYTQVIYVVGEKNK